MRLPATPTVTLMRELVRSRPHQRRHGRTIIVIDNTDPAWPKVVR